MELARRTRWIAYSLPVALAAVAALARPAPPGVLAAAAAGPDRPCPSASEAAGPSRDKSAPSTWYRLEPVLDADGTLVGQRLTAGRGTTRWTAQLPPESFASGPVGGRVLVGDDDGRRSRLRMLDTVVGCWSLLGTEASVIRSALLADDASGVYEHRVDRTTRRDLGVFLRELRAPAASHHVIAGLDPDSVHGPTFSTTLLLGEDGQLAVTSCGERACRTRVVDPATGAVSATRETGPAVGVVGRQLVALAPCEGLPCPIQVIDVVSGRAEPLGKATGPAALAADGSGALILSGEEGLAVARRDGQAGYSVVPDTQQLAPIARTSTSETGFEAPRGLVAVGPLGSAADPSLVRLLDPATLQTTPGEVLP